MTAFSESRRSGFKLESSSNYRLGDVRQRLMKREPNLGCILFECTELAPSARAEQEMAKLPVWDFTTLTDWMYSGAVRRNFTGHI